MLLKIIAKHYSLDSRDHGNCKELENKLMSLFKIKFVEIVSFLHN